MANELPKNIHAVHDSTRQIAVCSQRLANGDWTGITCYRDIPNCIVREYLFCNLIYKRDRYYKPRELDGRARSILDGLLVLELEVAVEAQGQLGRQVLALDELPELLHELGVLLLDRVFLDHVV